MRDHEVAAVLKSGVDMLETFQINDARDAALAFLTHALGLRAGEAIERPQGVTDVEIAAFQRLLRRKIQGEPGAYIVGSINFLGLDISVDPSVLIPRANTQPMVERAVQLLEELLREPLLIADFGTGSGCIALVIASKVPRAIVFATDISFPALQKARANALRHDPAGRVRLLQADMVDCIATGSLDMLISSPPYVRDDAVISREAERHEPRIAFFGGNDGCDFYRRLIPSAERVLRPGGWAIFEVHKMPSPTEWFPPEVWELVELDRDTEGNQLNVRARRRRS